MTEKWKQEIVEEGVKYWNGKNLSDAILHVLNLAEEKHKEEFEWLHQKSAKAISRLNKDLKWFKEQNKLHYDMKENLIKKQKQFLKHYGIEIGKSIIVKQPGKTGLQLMKDVLEKEEKISSLEDEIKWLKRIHPSTSLTLSEKERGK